MAINAITGSFTGTGSSSSTKVLGEFDISLKGTWVGTVNVERSSDGTNWGVVESFTSNTEKRGFQRSRNVLYRFNCTNYTSGTINYELTS